MEELKTAPEPTSVAPGGKISTVKTRLKRGNDPVVVTIEAPGSEDESPSFQYLRFSAGLAYTTDVNGVTVEALSQRHPYTGAVTLKTMQEWARKDQWVARREALVLDWRRQIEAKMGEKTVQQAITDLDSTDKLFEQAMNKLMKGVGAVNSYEGLINATVRLMEFRANLRGQILSAVAPTHGTPGGPNSPLGQMPRPKLSLEDARAAASAIIQRRREEIRAETARREAEESAKAAEEKKPELRLLPGTKGT